MYKDQTFNQAVIEASSKEFYNNNEETIEMDFDTCVIKGDIECNYAQDSDGDMDRRTQMGQFCGHDEVIEMIHFTGNNFEKLVLYTVRH